MGARPRAGERLGKGFRMEGPGRRVTLRKVTRKSLYRVLFALSLSLTVVVYGLPSTPAQARHKHHLKPVVAQNRSLTSHKGAKRPKPFEQVGGPPNPNDGNWTYCFVNTMRSPYPPYPLYGSYWVSCEYGPTNVPVDHVEIDFGSTDQNQWSDRIWWTSSDPNSCPSCSVAIN